MAGDRAPEAGALGTMRALGSTLLEALGTRAELAVVELREEAERRKRMAVLGLAAAVLLGVALITGSFLVVLLFWETHRVAAAAGITALYALAGLAALVALRRQARAAPPPFHATLAELARDREMLERRHD